MWSQLATVITFASIVFGDDATEGPPGIKRVLSDGVRSVDFKLVYGDEDISIINEIINDFEKKSGLPKSIKSNNGIDPLPAEDVKCIMSVDRYCSEEMGEVKKVMIQAVKEDCAKCTTEEKNKAGRVIAAMIAHDPVAWKLFLTRSALLTKKTEVPKTVKEIKFKDIGEPEEVRRSPGNSFLLSGVKVRVKRYMSTVVN